MKADNDLESLISFVMRSTQWYINIWWHISASISIVHMRCQINTNFQINSVVHYHEYNIENKHT